MSTELVEVSTGEIVGSMGVIARMSPGEATEWAHWVREVMQAALTEGTDYGVIPGVDKPSLWKSGAELLLLAAGLGSTTKRESVDLDREGDRLGVYYKTTIHRGGSVVAECEGYAGYDESRYYTSAAEAEAKERANATRYQRNANPAKFAEYRAPWNTLIKIAQKRALVGATLIATASSGLFTQDLEDDRDVTPPPAAAPGSAAWATASGWESLTDLDAARAEVKATLKTRGGAGTLGGADPAGLWEDFQKPDGADRPARPRTAEEHRAWRRALDQLAERPESGPEQPEGGAEGPAGSETAAEAAEAVEGPVEDDRGDAAPPEDPTAADFADNGHRSTLDKAYADFGLDGAEGKPGMIERIRKMPRNAVVAQLRSRGVVLGTWDEDTERRLLGSIVVRNAVNDAQADAD